MKALAVKKNVKWKAPKHLIYSQHSRAGNDSAGHEVGPMMLFNTVQYLTHMQAFAVPGTNSAKAVESCQKLCYTRSNI